MGEFIPENFYQYSIGDHSLLKSDVVFVYRKDGQIYLHFAYERRYTKLHMKNWYGFGIEFVAVGEYSWSSDSWAWDTDTTDHDVKGLMRDAGFSEDGIDEMLGN